ncbi:MAG: 16S rRNA (cytosine(967)-C(5))-methyltransferase RsmB [Rickettsiales bacterium]
MTTQTTALQTRQCALSVLHQMQRGTAEVDNALEQELKRSNLEVRDRAFVTLLVLTVLRKRAVIDALLAAFIAKPLDAKAAFVTDVLRLGLAQLLWLDVPSHAAVHTGVELVKQSRFKGYAKLVNAVLQNGVRKGAEVLATVDEARLATPDWLWQSWCEAYGEETARKMAKANQSQPAVDVTVKEPSQCEKWQGALQAMRLPTGSLRLPTAGQIRELPGFAEGAWWVQDVAAAIPATLLGNVSGKQVLDLCAAPGGKTAQLAARGATVTALDRSARRMKRLDENQKRLGLECASVQGDVLEWEATAAYDAILLDAPCSATGTLRRHPEIAWRRSVDDVAELSALQLQMIEKAQHWLKPGGVLVYCVCSLEKAEGEAHIATVKQTCPDLRLKPIVPEEVGGLAELITPQGVLRALPHYLADQGGMDGFFAMRFEKQS